MAMPLRLTPPPLPVDTSGTEDSSGNGVSVLCGAVVTAAGAEVAVGLTVGAVVGVFVARGVGVLVGQLQLDSL
jgi:hypothetical protein